MVMNYYKNAGKLNERVKSKNFLLLLKKYLILPYKYHFLNLILIEYPTEEIKEITRKLEKDLISYDA